MTLKDFLQKAFTKDKEFKKAQKERKIERILDQREKNANERELERFNEEQRQEAIKMKLDQIRKQKRREIFSGNIIDKKNIFLGHKSILSDGTSTLSKQNMFFK